MAQSVERPTLAQVMISQLVGSSPVLGSVLTARSLEPALDSVSPSLAAPPLPPKDSPVFCIVPQCFSSSGFLAENQPSAGHLSGAEMLMFHRRKRGKK